MTLPDSLIRFLGQSPTPYHAVQAMLQRLESAGFRRLHEHDSWKIQPGERCVVVRQHGSLVAFIAGSLPPETGGLRLVGTHTDSPCLRVKPQPELLRHGYAQLGVEIYGGVLLNPWFDRDLSLAGRVTFENRAGQLQQALIDFRRALAVIPSLAIHLDREANNSRKVNPQTDVVPLLAQLGENGRLDFRRLLLQQLQAEHPGAEAVRVLDYDMAFYDTQPASTLGLQGEFIAGARLDNLLSCFAGVEALCQANGRHAAVLVCSDHEEVGSASASGAEGNFLRTVLERWLGSGERLVRILDRSLLVSADNAHGIHPNYSDRHDGNHGPVLNKGPVLKINANQRYASTSETQAAFRKLCEAADVPVQAFVVRNDMACGSTIGPITATALGVRTVDIGVPTFAMHSIRELAGTHDLASLVSVLTQLYNHDGHLLAS